MSVREFLKRRLGGSRHERGAAPLEDVAVLDPLDIPAQLGDLRSMEDGWLDGEGRAPAPAFIDWLVEGFANHYPDAAEPPHLYPTVEGGVQAEWSLGGHEVSLRFHPRDRTGEWHDLALDSDEEEIRELDLAQAQDWEWLAARVVALSQPT